MLRKEVAALKESIGGYEAQTQGGREATDAVLRGAARQEIAARSAAGAQDRGHGAAARRGGPGRLARRAARPHRRLARAHRPRRAADLRAALGRDAEGDRGAARRRKPSSTTCASRSAPAATCSSASTSARPIAASSCASTTTRAAPSWRLAPSSSSCCRSTTSSIIEGRVSPNDISHVHDGQDALVRLTALNQRLTPVIDGDVVYVSADAIADQQSQAAGQPRALPSPVLHRSRAARRRPTCTRRSATSIPRRACLPTSTSRPASARSSSTCCAPCSTASRALSASTSWIFANAHGMMPCR